MKKVFKLIVLSLIAFCLNNSLQAQAQVNPNAFGYYQDALRFTQWGQYGSGRIHGLAGAGSTLGGDLSAAYLNPAGLGFYNRNQFTITPNISFNSYSTQYNGETTTADESFFTLPNIGAAINFNKSDLIPGGWRGGTLAISYNRLNHFDQTLQFSGFNDDSSIIDAMLDNAFGLFPFQLTGLEQVGYDHYLINPDPLDNSFYLSFVEGFPTQTERLRKKGFLDQFSVAVGGNYDDKIYVGAGVGFMTARYSFERFYNESFQNSALSSFSIDELLRVRGNGINANLGLIVRPTQFFRIGASVTTPTWYTFSEESDAFYTSNYNNYDVADFVDSNGDRLILEDTVLNNLNSNTDLFISDYELTTPFKYNAGASLLIGKLGFITADVEFLDYSAAKVSSLDFSESADNETIQNIYQNTMNARLGAELRLSILRLRAGVALIGDPYDDSFDGVDRSQRIYSAGLGVYSKMFFADFGLSRTNWTQSSQSYAFFDGTGPVATTDITQYQARLTLGINF